MTTKPLHLIFSAALLLLVSTTSLAQYDTLHLYYNQISVKPHDTTLAKMDKWIKSLNGKHQDIRVIGYYHKLDFKKYAQERVDEMFLVLNRKARSLFTIEEMVTKKGKDYQRTTVDILYKPTGGVAAAKTTDKEPAEKKSEAKAEKSKDTEIKAAKTKKEDKEESAGTGGEEKVSSKPKKEKESKEKIASDSDKSDEKVSGEKKSKKDKSEEKESTSEKKDKKEKKSGSKNEKPGETETWEAKPIE